MSITNMNKEQLPAYQSDTSPDEKHNYTEKSKIAGSRDASPPGYGYPPPDITAAFSNLKLDDESSPRPTVEQCIAHLKLLEAFHQLREDIGARDGLFGIRDDFVPPDITEARQRTEMLARIREKRWAIYVTRAVTRFRIYWEKCLHSAARPLRMADIGDLSYSESVRKPRPMQITRDNLPPLDCLMVMHSYMLNPRCFLSDCLRYGKMDLWATGFPWEAIVNSIDNISFQYQPSEAAHQRFESWTARQWDNLNDKNHNSIDCPNCNYSFTAPWTTCNKDRTWLSSNTTMAGTGFADPNFTARCGHCGVEITHTTLRVRKFNTDLQLLLKDDVPMPGTFLTLDGVVERYTKKTDAVNASMFPDRFLRSSLGDELLIVTKSSSTTVDEIRRLIEDGLKNTGVVRPALSSSSGTLPKKEERIAIRRMMASFWENSSIFGIDLVGAVIRQGSFVEKMHSIDWLHSPATTSTMARLVVKYERFFKLMGSHAGKLAVPTLDVDLAWHTHQLNPRSYYSYSLHFTSRFIDHDDKIADSKLSDAFEWTSKMYQRYFREVYSECTCWYCESIRESHTSTLSRVFRSSKDELSQSLDNLHTTATANDPSCSVHISAHSAIACQDASARASATVKAAKLERNYQKACGRAKKRGYDPPVRDPYLYSYAYWGYPMYVPYYAPYMGDGCSENLYASNPACASFEPGASGNCAAGTCGGGVAAGACGGSGGACAGGNAGGCGAGSGGDGGGDGGGGGCGGGCGGG